MKIKTLTAMLANCFLLSNLAVANETIAPTVSVQEKNPCQEKSFWETNFPKGQFSGFYSQMTNEVISSAQFQFANQYFDGSVFKKDLSRALDLYQRAHARGNHQASSKLGLMHRYGLSIDKDYQKAFTYYQSVADHNPEAQFNLGLMHRYGIGTAMDHKKAFAYFKQASGLQVVSANNCQVELQGMVEAQYQLGQMYHYGKGSNVISNRLWCGIKPQLSKD